ncbi:MAG: hypothetical protein L6W00_15160 [Lentisphaeria bacterium]|nr:MAG: hypothetical protein L6W00_15160 [Lentisphaeria bacterium]
MTKEIVCNWRECRSADAATRELLRSAVDPGAVTEAVGSFFLEKSGVERPSFFSDRDSASSPLRLGTLLYRAAGLG